MSKARRLRIAGGSRRGLRIEVPGGIRPSSARLREALFDIWSARVGGAGFLDLFAGSGGVGIEAASRGAASVLLVEGDRQVFAALERNLRQAGMPGVSALRARLPDELERRLPPGARFDLVFADPPYGFRGQRELLAAIEPWLAAGAEVALEHPWRDDEPVPPAALSPVSRRRYGDSGLAIFELSRDTG